MLETTPMTDARLRELEDYFSRMQPAGSCAWPPGPIPVFRETHQAWQELLSEVRRLRSMRADKPEILSIPKPLLSILLHTLEPTVLEDALDHLTPPQRHVLRLYLGLEGIPPLDSYEAIAERIPHIDATHVADLVLDALAELSMHLPSH